MTSDPLIRAFDRLVERAPAVPLLVSPSHRVTVAEVAALARSVGARLPAPPEGPTPGEPVGLQSANGPGFLAALVALRRAGLAPVLLDRRTPELERHRVAAEVGARFVLVGRCAWPRSARDLHLEPAEAAGAGAGAGAEPAAVPPGTAVIKLSSGSAGTARGIAATAASLVADDEALTATMGIGPDDRLLATIPFSHSYGLSSLVVPALVRGTLLVLPDHDGPFGPLAAAADAGATVFPTVPAWLAALNRLAEPPPLPPSLRRVLTAGALLPAGTSALFRERFGLTPHVFYGASECGGICYDREGGAAERGTVGEPVAGVTVELLPVDREETGDGGGLDDAGRVVVRSPALALGYLPPETARLDGDRYVTDDLAEWRNGELALCGRLNDLINVKGKKVNPREVERVLRGLASVDEAAVMAAPAVRAAGRREEGSREPVVRAVVASRSGTLTPETVVAWCRRHLADHKVPRSVLVVDTLPRTERGKVDRQALVGSEEGPAPGERLVASGAGTGAEGSGG